MTDWTTFADWFTTHLFWLSTVLNHISVQIIDWYYVVKFFSMQETIERYQRHTKDVHTNNYKTTEHNMQVLPHLFGHTNFVHKLVWGELLFQISLLLRIDLSQDLTLTCFILSCNYFCYQARLTSLKKNIRVVLKSMIWVLALMF